jgi:hypothetical protein
MSCDVDVVSAGGRLHGGAVQGQPGRGVPPRGRRQDRGRSVAAGYLCRVQPLPDRFPPPRCLRRRGPEVPAPVVHPGRRGPHLPPNEPCYSPELLALES